MQRKNRERNHYLLPVMLVFMMSSSYSYYYDCSHVHASKQCLGTNILGDIDEESAVLKVLELLGSLRPLQGVFEVLTFQIQYLCEAAFSLYTSSEGAS